MHFGKYFISDQDEFSSVNYPEIARELTTLSLGMRYIPGYGKTESIVSFLKNHSIRTELIRGNPVLIDLIRSETFKVSHIELLFEACREKRAFLRDYENYVCNRLNETSDAQLNA